ncbi:MAG TPA: UDP-N-acetylmuramoyl-L-alanyl-D-glutamate--2,6-diaminopimelate ligase [Thermomicrobiales bacterium]|nr:UDP-N-acetylmuramoyl-L-alanyl-D-glutamate--2,6-diaminopimelate ligase [Thermomicrobiales bacterium]
MRLSDLLTGIDACDVTGDATVDIDQIEFDSRLVTPGSLFVALRGGYTDGHLFLQQARDRGAIAAVVEIDATDAEMGGFRAVVRATDNRALLARLATRFYAAPSQAMTVVGVTGTDGKTTTSYFIEAMCRHAGRRTGMIGTVAVRIGADIDLHESRQTTPESLHIQHYLAEMRDHGVDLAVVEATSHGLELHRLDGCDFDIGVITNVTHEHLDFHGSIENYRRAKGGLLRRVASARQLGKLGIAVINADDEGARSIEPDAAGCTILRYSTAGAAVADVQAEQIETDPAGATFVLRTPAGSHPAHIHLPGAYNIANAMAAVSVGVALGIPIETIVGGIASLRAVPGRMETVSAGQPFAVIVDYAHTPDAIRSVLREARKLATGQVLVVFGSAGERDVAKRAVQGAVAVTDADFAVFTSEDPRFEDPDAIVDEIAAGAVEAGGRRGVDFDCIEDRRQAIAAALDRAGAGDVVVLAGKGHEQSMIYGSEKRPWNEAAVAREILRQLGYQRNDDSGGSER